MNWQAISFDWNQARAFLATAEEGSFSAAAKALGQSQPTLSRQVAALEQALGVALFERVGRSVSLTQTGRELISHFQSMGEAAGRISLSAAGLSQTVEGQVCITASDLLATLHLPPVIKKLHAIAPNIQIELQAANDLRDLLRREADIAVRHVRPDQPDLIAKLICEPTAHFYASRDYLDRVGRPKNRSDLAKMDFIGFDKPEVVLEQLRQFSLNIDGTRINVISSTGTVMLELARQGLGVCVLPDRTAQLFPEMEKLLPEKELIRFPVWLATHRELHTSRRIRIVFDLLAEELTKFA